MHPQGSPARIPVFRPWHDRRIGFPALLVLVLVHGGLLAAGVAFAAAPEQEGGGERSDLVSSRVLSIRASESALRPGSSEPFEIFYGDPAQSRVRYWWNGLPQSIRERS